jgi:PDZ domain
VDMLAVFPQQVEAAGRQNLAWSCGNRASSICRQGAEIVEVQRGSVAELAMLRVGDVITAVDGKPVKSPMEVATSDTCSEARRSVTSRKKRICSSEHKNDWCDFRIEAPFCSSRRNVLPKSSACGGFLAIHEFDTDPLFCSTWNLPPALL